MGVWECVWECVCGSVCVVCGSVCVVWECVCVCSLSYPARKAHTPFCHLWPVWLYNIFPHYLMNGTIFGEKLFDIKCVFV